MSYYDGSAINTDVTWTCCNDEQSLFILLYLAFALMAILFHDTLIAKPVRLISTFIHEWSHAISCWLTNGDVRAIQVYDNDGGVTTFVGGLRCIIIPAGYVGLALSAMGFVIMSGGRTSATIAIAGFTFSLILALCYSPNQLMVIVNIVYTLLNVVILLVEYFVYTPVLQYLVLYYGVTVGMYAIIDIHDDTVFSNIEGSDAHACHSQVWPCCHPQLIGFQWAVLAIVCQMIGIWISLLQMSEECDSLGWSQCLNLSIGAGLDNSGFSWNGLWSQVNYQ